MIKAKLMKIMITLRIALKEDFRQQQIKKGRHIQQPARKIAMKIIQKNSIMAYVINIGINKPESKLESM